jgi:hypothetical protein
LTSGGQVIYVYGIGTSTLTGSTDSNIGDGLDGGSGGLQLVGGVRDEVPADRV